jgi:hypothetical protein
MRAYATDRPEGQRYASNPALGNDPVQRERPVRLERIE